MLLLYYYYYIYIYIYEKLIELFVLSFHFLPFEIFSIARFLLSRQSQSFLMSFSLYFAHMWLSVLKPPWQTRRNRARKRRIQRVWNKTPQRQSPGAYSPMYSWMARINWWPEHLCWQSANRKGIVPMERSREWQRMSGQGKKKDMRVVLFSAPTLSFFLSLDKPGSARTKGDPLPIRRYVCGKHQ